MHEVSAAGMAEAHHKAGQTDVARRRIRRMEHGLGATLKTHEARDEDEFGSYQEFRLYR